MRFKQIQALKERAYEAFATGGALDVPDADAARLDPLALALVGDAAYSLYMRRRLVETKIPQVQVLHTLAAEFVSAKAQAYVYRQIKDDLDDVSREVCQRARNAYSKAPKSATVAEYHDATALEALVGYYVMAGEDDTLQQLFVRVYEETKHFCADRHQSR